MEKAESYHIASGNIKWYNHCGIQLNSLSKRQTQNYYTI